LDEDAKKIRRKMEELLRKDPEFYEKVLQLYLNHLK
jgi:hypothetical protein